MMQKYRFQRREYLLIGDLVEGGALATERQYREGRESYAHLFPDGFIMRHGGTIGRAKDLVPCGEVEDVAPSGEGFMRLVTGEGWSR